MVYVTLKHVLLYVLVVCKLSGYFVTTSNLTKSVSQ